MRDRILNNVILVLISALISLSVCVLNFNFVNKKYKLSDEDKLAFIYVNEIYNQITYGYDLRVVSGGFNDDKSGGWFLVSLIYYNNPEFHKYFVYKENNEIFVERTYDDYFKYFCKDEFNIYEINKKLMY